MTWDLNPGDELPRRELHERLGGGSRQNGMTRVSRTDDLLLFSSSAGGRYGYNFDGWKTDGAFHYTGEGQEGDQRFIRGNLQLRDHSALGLRPRLFEEAGRAVVRYVGEFRVDQAHAWYPEEALDRNEDEPRKVIVFRLLPVHIKDPAPKPEEVAVDKPSVRDVPIEAFIAETFYSAPRREPTISERREANLVQRYITWLLEGGSIVTRKEIRLPDLGHALYTDLFDGSRAELVEAKSSASRNHIRLALGQVLDYARHVEHRSRAVLLPSDPGDDLTSLLNGVGIACIFESEPGTFIRVDPEGRHDPSEGN
jgi:hypothetical protein